MAEDHNWNVYIDDRSDQVSCLGVWGPNARKTIQAIADDPAAWDEENFPFAASRKLTLQGIPVEAFRISYVGEQGWELHVDFSYGLSLWDLVTRRARRRSASKPTPTVVAWKKACACKTPTC